MPVMSQRAYARQRGVSVSTVQKAIGTGRIHTLPNGQIDSEIADVEWVRNTQTQAPPVDRRGQQTRRRRGGLRRVAVHEGPGCPRALPSAPRQDRLRGTDREARLG